MARTVDDVRLDNRSARARLEPRKKPYYRVIETGRHIGYYKGNQTGSWLARTYDGKRYVEKTLGTADDTRDANGLDVLSFSEAQALARKWFDDLAKAGSEQPVGPYLISQACDDYLAEYNHRQGKDPKQTSSRLEKLKERFGAIEVSKLTTKQVKDWHRELGEIGRMTASRKLDENGQRVRLSIDLADTEAKRRRLNSSNRNLTVFKAVLNHAYKNQQELKVSIPSKVAWQSASPARSVDAPKIRYLLDDETTRFLNSCEGDFRDLVAAALLTGARYGELCRFKVRDFDAKAASIYVAISKSGKPRSIALTDEGVAHFARLAAGRAGDDVLLQRSDGTCWRTAHQARRMRLACQAAKIAPEISFHILRHTYGSRLAMRGAAMAVIAKQLGHADTRMTERHYAHLAPSYVSDVVRGLLGTFGVPVVNPNVVAFSPSNATASDRPADEVREVSGGLRPLSA